ncbi:MAG: hypothetical protein KBC81_01965 [Candidatus Pacebacteria bacterium]|nr:hypothetical protein [Candidatus Paceibacterota bacterium]
MSTRSSGATDSLSDYEILRKIIKAKSSGPDGLDAIARIGRTVHGWSINLEKLFVSGPVAVDPHVRLDDAQNVLNASKFILNRLDPNLMSFSPSDAPMHVAGAIRELQRLVRELTDLLKDKKAVAEKFRISNGLEVEHWYVRDDV